MRTFIGGTCTLNRSCLFDLASVVPELCTSCFSPAGITKPSPALTWCAGRPSTVYLCLVAALCSRGSHSVCAVAAGARQVRRRSPNRISSVALGEIRAHPPRREPGPTAPAAEHSRLRARARLTSRESGAAAPTAEHSPPGGRPRFGFRVSPSSVQAVHPGCDGRSVRAFRKMRAHLQPSEPAAAAPAAEHPPPRWASPIGFQVSPRGSVWVRGCRPLPAYVEMRLHLARRETGATAPAAFHHPRARASDETQRPASLKGNSSGGMSWGPPPDFGGRAEGMMTMEQSLAELIRANRITRDTAPRMDASASHHREFPQSRLWAVVRAGGDGTGLQS
jgi:hypothetical protein